MKKTFVLAPLALIAALSAPAFAAPETYVISEAYGHTFPSFSWNHLGYSTQSARFDKTSGTVSLDLAAEQASVDVSIDTKSVNTGSALFNEHIQAEAYFDTSKFPTATFKSTAVKFKAGVPATIDGVLTIKGISKPVTLTVNRFKNAMHPLARKDAIGADASVVVKRSEFNMSQAVPFVSDEVTISIAFEALKK